MAVLEGHCEWVKEGLPLELIDRDMVGEGERVGVREEEPQEEVLGEEEWLWEAHIVGDRVPVPQPDALADGAREDVAEYVLDWEAEAEIVPDPELQKEGEDEGH